MTPAVDDRQGPDGVLTEDSRIDRIAGSGTAPLKKAGVLLVRDLLDRIPKYYLQPGELTDLGALEIGSQVVVAAEVLGARAYRPRNRRQEMLTVTITDGRSEMDLVFFKAWGHKDKLQPGVSGWFAGEVGVFRGRRQLTHPTYEVASGEDAARVAERHRTHKVPVYRAAGKLDSFAVRRVVDQVLDTMSPVHETVPTEILATRGLLGRHAAYERVHRPLLEEDPRDGVRRLKYDEALVLQLALAQRRHEAMQVEATPRRPREGGLLAAFDERLPFALTDGQREVGAQIAADMERTFPMHRLLQGEVGSGKTLVALRAMLAAVDAGGQAALLAPTEVLAVQHHRSITALLGDLAEGGLLGGAEHGTRVTLLTGSQSAGERKKALLQAASGEAGIVVGTHALIQDKVQFADLALVVVDEQHRFGVEQRDALRDKGIRAPHVLVMTATPIPRSVAMTVFGDMETSTLRELPRGRQPITTHVVDLNRPAWRERVWTRIAEECAAGRQAYVVCPRIGDEESGGTGTDADGFQAWDEPPPEEDDGETAALQRELTSVVAMTAMLREHPALADLRIEMLHGRLPTEDKDRIMRAYSAGEVDVLVATTVIEVGVDVPNATVMAIADADRFGISQLHQLRGRIGRGEHPGLCLLMTVDPPESALERLRAMEASTDGFELARLDLQQRREGDVLGARQSGRSSSLRHLRLGVDDALIADAREDAVGLVQADPTLSEWPVLARLVKARIDEEQAAYLERG